jgi:hypothetical protein
LGIRSVRKIGEEAIGAYKHFGLTLEVHLSIFVERIRIHAHVGIKDRVELVPVGSAQKERNEILDLIRGIYLRAIELRLEIVYLVRIGFFGKKGRAVIVLKRLVRSWASQ